MTRILVADDDEMVREYIKIRLAVDGNDVVEAEDGLKALHCVTDQSFDLIFLDDVMPGLSGWEFLAAARALPKPLDPIVFMTQLLPQSIFEKAAAAGVSKILGKPFCGDELARLAKKMTAPKIEKHGILASIVAAASLWATPHGAAQAQTVTAIPAPGADIFNAASTDMLTDAVTKTVDDEKLIISTSHEWSWISRGSQRDWRTTQLAVVYSPKKTAHYTVEALRLSRFGRTDTVISGRADWRVAHNASAHIGLTLSPEANFKEKVALRAGAALGLGFGIELSADGGIADYASGSKFLLKPQIGLSLAKERVILSAGWINLWETGGKHYQGWSARMGVSPHEKLKLFAGMARYPEVETGITRRVKSTFGGIRFQFSQSINGSLGYSRDAYEAAFKRHALTFGLSWRMGKSP